GSRSATTTLAPSAANRAAIAAPMPLAPPVTTTTLPSSRSPMRGPLAGSPAIRGGGHAPRVHPIADEAARVLRSHLSGLVEVVAAAVRHPHGSGHRGLHLVLVTPVGLGTHVDDRRSRAHGAPDDEADVPSLG